MLVGDLMTRELVTLAQGETLSIADRIMTLGRIRHMPVVDQDGRLVGLISQRDLFRGALARAIGFGGDTGQRVLETVTVAEIMTTKLHTALADMPIAEAAQVMVTHKIGSLPVVDGGGRLIGILTESDFVRQVGRAG